MVNQANSGVILVNHQENTSIIRNANGKQIMAIFSHGLMPTDRLKIRSLNRKINEMAKICICEERVNVVADAPSLGCETLSTSLYWVKSGRPGITL